ncbi:MAG: Regulatory protein recX [Firmicutes bacterium]|nr:Regulatory protein recX [Bacillota bacterium]
MMSMNEQGERLAIKWLAARALSENEVEARLLTSGFSSDEAKRVVAAVRDRGFVNDMELGRMLFRKYQRMGRYGVNAIRDRLRKRGLSEPVIAAVFCEFDGFDEYERAVALLRQRFPIVTAENRGKAGRFLAYRGFTTGTVLKVMEYLSNVGDY